MSYLSKGQYRARVAKTTDDLRAAQALRHTAFVGWDAPGLDRDAFDEICTHVLIDDATSCDR